MKLRFLNFKILKSTNEKAIKLIKANSFKPTIISSRKQTKGKGTMGKKWISKKGNLFLSIFFEFNPQKINFNQYAILNAILIKKILKRYVTKKIIIKWPNDLLIEKKKICGILQEVISCNKKNFIIIGIGINTNSSPSISEINTACLKDYSKKNVDNRMVLKDIKKAYEKFIDEIQRYKYLSLKKRFK
tara:strand:+ start:32 stop:595 length:564 start_codon:yes stop_codon:yes gene_type:complete